MGKGRRKYAKFEGTHTEAADIFELITAHDAGILRSGYSKSWQNINHMKAMICKFRDKNPEEYAAIRARVRLGVKV